MNNPRSIFTNPASFDCNSETHRSRPLQQSTVDSFQVAAGSEPTSHPTSAPREPRPPLGTRPSLSISGLKALRGLDGFVVPHPVPGPERLESRGRSISDPEALGDSAEQNTGKTQEPVTPNNNDRKRRFDEPPTAGPSSEPSHKRARLPLKKRHILNHFNFSGPSFNNTQPPSPLFFSNSASARPPLPARFSSSEAAARMLSKAKTEDSHVKTVSLARGTVSTPAIPAGMPLRSTSDRSSVARSISPDSFAGIRNDPSLALISSIGVVELLEQDERPTMIVDLGDSSNYGAGQLRPLFVNSSLRSFGELLQSVTGQSGEASTDVPGTRSFVEFKSWVLSAAVNGESLNVCLPSFNFGGVSWSCSTLRKRLRLISGALNADFVSPGPRATIKPVMLPLPEQGPAPSQGSASVIPSAEEPLDYFGNAAPPRTTDPASSTSGDIVLSTETPLSAPPRSSTSDVGDLEERMRQGSGALSMIETPTITEGPSFDWTRIPITENMPRHIQFARSIDWASTALGPIEFWSPDLRQMCNLIMASPHPAAMYWGDDLIAIYNEAYILLAGQKHPALMGQSYAEAWKEIWDEVKEVFANAKVTGEATMKDDDCLFIKRSDYLEETYFSWSIIPMVGSDGTVMGLYNPAFEKTRRKIAERRMLTLREIGERTASARDVRAFWEQVLSALELNDHDTPFVLLYSVADDADSDASSIHSINYSTSGMQCTLEGTLGVPEGHPAAPASMDLRVGNEGFAPVFREVIKTDKPVVLEVGSKDLPPSLLQDMEQRGFGDTCRSVVICPIHPTTGEAVLGFLVMGINPRRPYDDDYSLFVQLLSRQLATSLASVVLFEEEIRRGQRAAKLAALDRLELSEQLAARTQEAIESETKFTRMAEFAPVGMFIANAEGKLIFCNDTWFEVSRIPKQGLNDMAEKWMDAIKEEDRQAVRTLWQSLKTDKKPVTSTFRFETPWQDPDGTVGERWVLFAAYPEKYETGNVKSIFGSFTDISKHKWAEGFQKRKMEEAVELKRQQENFIDMTSHEMRNPLSAILQCADEIATTMTRFRDQLALKPEASSDTKQLTPGIKENIDDNIAGTLEAAQTIGLCAQHQKRIVDDILTLSKLDSQLLLVTPVDAQPLTVVQRALKMHEGELQSNDIQLKFVVDPSFKRMDIDWVRFDPSRVLQVLINLTTNAIKFTTTEKKRTITVSLAASRERPSTMESRIVDYFQSRQPERPERFAESDWGDGEEVYIHFAVQDTGRGLTPEEKKMLFLRFSQASPRTHVQYGGSGLGLFISRQLTELQGGEIGVASEAGQGSTFAFYVKGKCSRGPENVDGPNGAAGKIIAQLDQSASSISSMEASKSANIQGKRPSADKKKHILLVEDNLVNQRVLQRQLKNLGCTVHVANHGGEALDRLKQSVWWKDPTGDADKLLELSVVLMDQEMPVMDGLTATKKIREMEKEGKLVRHVPVIAVTANARNEQIKTAIEAGMDDVVSKPFRIPDLIPKIEELMDKYPEPTP